MRVKLVLCCFFMATLVSLSTSQYDQCRITWPFGMETGKIPDDHIHATTYSYQRGPKQSRMRHRSSWQASRNDFKQYLTVDLSIRKMITQVATQGMRGSQYWVTDYYVQYSSDNVTWSYVKDNNGDPLMFVGNKDGNTIEYRRFSTPIVARFIRFNPQRWHLYMSLRVEIYGCNYYSTSLTFDGNSRIEYDVSGANENIQTQTDVLKMRFRTDNPNGLMFFADSNQGDYFGVELYKGQLKININLGSWPTIRSESRLYAGSLLDDSQWHDLEIMRNRQKLIVTVDRLTINDTINGTFWRLDLDRKISVGGVKTYLGRRGVTTRKGFNGCMENILFNDIHLLRDAVGKLPRFFTSGNTTQFCQLRPLIPITFPSTLSHLKLLPTTTGIKTFSMSLDFRTYNLGGMLAYHQIENGEITVKLDKGRLVFYIQLNPNIEILETLESRDSEARGSYADGLWHSMNLHIEENKVIMILDGFTWVAQRKISIQTAADKNIFIGGGISKEMGFVGCMRKLTLQGTPYNVNRLPAGANTEAVNGTCGLRDRCRPNPCEHWGRCSQDWRTFRCDCSDTGYTGATCHMPNYPLSCNAIKQELIRIGDDLSQVTEERKTIDIDGSGYLPPFNVTCNYKDDEMWISHANEDVTPVNGFQEAGSYRQVIHYDANLYQLNEVIRRAVTCKQHISYSCWNSRLLSSPPTKGSGGEIRRINQFGWWVSRTYQDMDYWGGSTPGSKKCKCGLEKRCQGGATTCNCDRTGSEVFERYLVDSGFLSYKDHLPVMELRLGDTGTLVDSKAAKYQLGKLMCKGDNLFDDVVTFRKVDAALEFGTFNPLKGGDIRFQFKTTASSGILIINRGELNGDFIEVRLVSANILQFRFNVGYGIQVLSQSTAYPLNNNKWHTVHTERNRKQASLQVDTMEKKILDEPMEFGFKKLRLNTPLYIGADTKENSYRDGFVGCMRALQVNGEAMNMMKKVVTEAPYGMTVGCIGKCDSSPCLNNGRCVEHYHSYECDCTYTPWRGIICGREVGVNLDTSQMVRFEFDEAFGRLSTDEETFRIGFITQDKQGLLMQVTDAANKEFISIEMNNNGGILVNFNVGFGFWQVSTPTSLGVDFANKQQHELVVQRRHGGRIVSIKVDDYPEKIDDQWKDYPASTDTKLDNPKWLYMGRNTTTGTGGGFKGCLFRAAFDNNYPLKNLFQDPKPPNVDTAPVDLNLFREDRCGYEEIFPPPEAVEKRRILPTTPPPPGNGTIDNFDAESGAVIGGVVAVVCIVILALVVIGCRHMSRHKGEYLTNEARGADAVDHADLHIVNNQSGQPDIQKKREWYI